MAGIVLVIGAILIGTYVWSIEEERLRSIRGTIISSGKLRLEDVLKMYPEEMHEEVSEQWDKVYGREKR